MAEGAFAAAIFLFVLTVISPGPAVLAILSTGMSQGRLRALVLTAGILSGSFSWGLIALFGFAGAMNELGYALVYLKIAGALYLLWLAWKALRNALSSEDPTAAKIGSGSSLKNLYLSGLALHLTNPKAVFGWAATIAIGIGPGDGFADAALLIFICMTIVATLKTAMAVAFSSAPAMRAYTKARRTIQGTVAGFFSVAGVGLLADALRR